MLITIPNQLGLFKTKALITTKQMYLFRNTTFRSVTAVTEIKIYFNTFTAIVYLSRFNNSCLKSRQRRP